MDYNQKLEDRMYHKYSYAIEKEDCHDLAEDILAACAEKPKYMVPLKEWMNGKTRFQDCMLHDFSLVDLACRLDGNTPNIPVAILIFYLEETAESEYRALTVVAHQYCICDINLLKGTLCKFAVKDEDVWYFFDNDQKTENLKECQMWQVLLLNPGLIIQMTYSHTDGMAIILQDDYSYLIKMDAGRKE